MADISQKLIARLGADLSDYKKKLRSAVTEARSAGRLIQSSMNRATSAARTLAKGVGLVAIAITGIGALAVREFFQWEAAMTGVAKTVDATDEQIRQLGQTFVSLSETIPVSANELARLGEVAGQLGVELPNIRDFVEVAAALGVSTNLMAEDAATGLARMSNVMGTATEDVDKLGSTIVALGNNLATTEREILDMSLRITGAGNQVGLTEAQVLSFSAALSSLGIRSEAGGSAISRVFAEIASSVASGGDRLKDFSKIAGTTVSEFSRQFKEDAAGAVVTFIEGLKKLSDEGGNVFGALEKVQFADIRVRDTLLRAAGGVETLREALRLGNVAWEENTALTEEANRFYNRAGARLTILRNKLSNVAAEMGEKLVPVVDAAIGVLSGFLDQVRAAGPALGEFASKAAAAIPAMTETVVNSIGSIGLKLLSVVEFFTNNPLAGGLGLAGLVFLGPGGAAAFGTIGFIIDALVEKFGGPQTVAEALNEKLRTQVDIQADLLRRARLMEKIGFASEIAEGRTTAQLREEAELLGRSIEGIKRTIQGLGPEDFVAMGEDGSEAFGKVADGIRTALERMVDFKATLGGLAGRDEEGGLADAVDLVDSMRFSFEPLPRLTEEVSVNVKKWVAPIRDFTNEATRVADTISSGIGSALSNIVTGVQGVSDAMVQLGKTIIRTVVAALTEALLKAVILKAVFTALGIGPATSVASSGSGVFGSRDLFEGARVGSFGDIDTPISPAGLLNTSGDLAAGISAGDLDRIIQGATPNSMQIPIGAAGSGPQEVSVRLELPDVEQLPSPVDFGIIASKPQIMRLFNEMMRQARLSGAT